MALTGGIAHHFNNIFTVILANSEGLLSGQTLNERDKQAAELIHAATERGASLTQLESAILNLGINARDAMATGGTLSIKTSKMLIGPEQARPGQVERPGEYVCLTISDTGAAMPPHVLEPAVERFFMTKGLEEGTGLGLSMAAVSRRMKGTATCSGGSIVRSGQTETTPLRPRQV